MSQKRQRSAASPPVDKMRGMLASRIADVLPRHWRHNALSGEFAGADAFLSHLGRSVAAALQSLSVSAEEARTHLRDARSALHAVIDARCDELAATIDSAELDKVSALERELVGIDAALEGWRTDFKVVREAVSSLSDEDVVMQHDYLSSRVDEIEAQLLALPTAVVEPPFVGLLTDIPPLISSIRGFGRALVPLPVSAADISVEGIPRSALAGSTLHLRLSLGARHADQCTEELEVSLGCLKSATCIQAGLVGPGVILQPLHVTVTPDASSRSLLVSIEIEYAGSHCSTIDIAAVLVAGKRVSGLPCSLPVYRGITAPLALRSSASNGFPVQPCISPEGRVYCPPGDDPDVLVFDADGKPLPSLSLSISSLGLVGQCFLWVAYAHNDAPSLLIADDNDASSHIVAVDPVTNAIRWTAMLDCTYGCRGVAALPALGVAIVACGDNNYQDSLVAHRLTDGVCVAKISVSDLSSFVAADPATGTVFGAIETWKKTLTIY